MKAKKVTKKRVNLSVRERRLIKNLLTGMPATEAMIKAGYAESTANKKQKQVVGKGRIQSALAEEMERQGITDKMLTKKLHEGLDATKVISAMVMPGKDAKDADSMTKDFIEVDDFAVRHKYLETGLKLKGYLRDKVDVEHSIETHEERLKRLRREKRCPTGRTWRERQLRLLMANATAEAWISVYPCPM